MPISHICGVMHKGPKFHKLFKDLTTCHGLMAGIIPTWKYVASMGIMSNLLHVQTTLTRIPLISLSEREV